MYDRKTTCRLGYGLWARQLKLGRRMNRSALGDGLRDDRAAGSAAAPQQALPQEKNARLGDCRLYHGLRIRQPKLGAAAATGSVCGVTRYSRQRDVLVVMRYRKGN